ncbi:SAM domain and HD [Thoreauomyces humboldtii]|nr:SAM domain and HD [Thoreauomyces humboldtii]
MDFDFNDGTEFSASPLATEKAAALSYSKVINDPIHGHVELDDYCMQVVDTIQFQRLRDLKQLGSAYFVFPGASHNRFEHSIGVCYLAGVMVEHLRKAQPELGITDNDVKCVKLAGLCHDLGHGPFSHIFDNEFMKQARPGFNWTHEDASEDMLQYLVDDNQHVNINIREIRFIKDLIHGEPRSEYPQAEKRFLFDIVANKRNSVDVDKFDYIQRDCHNVGIKTSLDAGRLMTFSRVIDNQICFNQKEAFNLYEMFHTRFCLFKQIYTHRVGKATEYMITEALLAADKHLGISSSVGDMPRYVYITDAIVKEIERSKSSELAESRAILERIRKRDLYRFVDQILVPTECAEEVRENITPKSVVQFSTPGDMLSENDVIIEWLKLGYAMKDKNPVDLIKFFQKWHPNHSFHIKREHVSTFLPNNFEEITLRVFARDNEKRKKIQLAFRRLVHHLNSSEALRGLQMEVGTFKTEQEIEEEEEEDDEPDLLDHPSDQRKRPQHHAEPKPVQNLFNHHEVPEFAHPFPPSFAASPVGSVQSSQSNVGSAQNSPMRHRLSTSEATLLPQNYASILYSPARKRPRLENDINHV